MDYISGGPAVASIPRDWSARLSDSPLIAKHRSDDALAPKVWVAECESCPGGAVAIKSMMPRVWEVRNQIRALGLLRSSGNVVGYLGSQVFVDRVFLFMEAADESLADYIDRLWASGWAHRGASGDWALGGWRLWVCPGDISLWPEVR